MQFVNMTIADLQGVMCPTISLPQKYYSFSTYFFAHIEQTTYV